MMNASWTDWFFLSLISLSLALLIGSLRNPPTRQMFKVLLQNPLAVSSGMIFFIFLSIASMDCIHLSMQDNLNERNTLLDKILAPLGQTYEKTFSAPLSLELYVTETHMKNGHLESVRPKLRYPADTLKTNALRNQFIAVKLIEAFIAALVAVLLGAIINLFAYGRHFSTSVKAGLITLGLIVFFIILLYSLSRQLHVFGTGKIGQDILYNAIKSIRTGLVIGILTTLFTLPFALLFGVAAGYYGGIVDDIIQYVYTTLSSIPGVLLITASVLSMQTYIANHPHQFRTLAQQADARLLALCIILGVTSWTSLCRLLRAEAMKLRHIDYVLAAKVLGVSSLRILRTHLLPNVMHIVLITLVLDFSYLILAEALLTYVGVGVSPVTMSWGNMINSARLELARDPIVWWPVSAAFCFMFTLVLASNVFADAVESAWDPKAGV